MKLNENEQPVGSEAEIPSENSESQTDGSQSPSDDAVETASTEDTAVEETQPEQVPA